MHTHVESMSPKIYQETDKEDDKLTVRMKLLPFQML